jgi:hypothetical protein
MAGIDRWITRDPESASYTDKRLLTLTTTMGLGFQLLVFAVLSWVGHPEWIPWLILGPYSLLWLLLMVDRRASAVRAVS